MLFESFNLRRKVRNGFHSYTGDFFKPCKVVKIFHHILFFRLLKLEYVSIRKLIRVVADSFINFFGFHSVELCHVGVQQYVLIAKPHDPVAYIAEFD